MKLGAGGTALVVLLAPSRLGEVLVVALSVGCVEALAGVAVTVSVVVLAGDPPQPPTSAAKPRAATVICRRARGELVVTNLMYHAPGGRG